MEHEKTEVVITDIKIPFWSMVVLIIKWTIAAIPAAIILFLIGLVLTVLFGATLGGCFALMR
ncbi:MAG: hypothetical protein FWG50_01615 [Kiritimatiellaeota bacterium]|nr:hypothetical protein [Kiritimatiellota bacterium]